MSLNNLLPAWPLRAEDGSRSGGSFKMRPPWLRGLQAPPVKLWVPPVALCASLLC